MEILPRKYAAALFPLRSFHPQNSTDNLSRFLNLTCIGITLVTMVRIGIKRGDIGTATRRNDHRSHCFHMIDRFQSNIDPVRWH